MIRIAFVATLVGTSFGGCFCGPSPRAPRAADGQFGALCSSNAQCATGFCCQTGTCPGGFCTNMCTLDTECPPGTLCGDVGGYTACMWSCGSTYDCPPDLCCKPHGGRYFCSKC